MYYELLEEIDAHVFRGSDGRWVLEYNDASTNRAFLSLVSDEYDSALMEAWDMVNPESDESLRD